MLMTEILLILAAGGYVLATFYRNWSDNHTDEIEQWLHSFWKGDSDD